MRCRSITARSLALHSGMAVLGGLAYMGIELLWRGRTHWTMGVLGGVCFVLIGLLDEVQEHPPLVGLVVNRWLGWGVWDYSDMPCNLWGQVCPQFSAAWFGLSFVAVKLENLVHWLLNGGKSCENDEK